MTRPSSASGRSTASKMRRAEALPLEELFLAVAGEEKEAKAS